tara:strand:+ start:2058 stop:2366 length:309 start_codon:yes stop_codon:yes gene_type:complete
LNNNQFSPNAISHKDLKNLLKTAKKEIHSINSSEYQVNRGNDEFNDLIANWSETSQKLLLILNKKNQILTKHRNPKSLIAFGAMGAHINMALQALKAIESEQ